jgi:TonB family protein
LVSANELIEHANPPGSAEAKEAALVSEATDPGKTGAGDNRFADVLAPPPIDKYSAVLRQYKQSLKKSIRRAWFPPKDGDYCIVRFSLSRSGKVSNLSIVHSGMTICNEAALRAVKNTQPLSSAIPQELPAPLEAVFRFDPYSINSGLRLYSPDAANTKATTAGSTEP